MEINLSSVYIMYETVLQVPLCLKARNLEYSALNFRILFVIFYPDSGMDLLWRRDREGDWSTLGASGGEMQKGQISTAASAVRNPRWDSSEHGKRPENGDSFPERKWAEDTPEE